ncbi:TolC family protein, partial [Bradyrhizobium sp. 2TAF24]|uniref:TolC family protein n=1 Tax=Bradyrhizobium sp. 2TAF24 TaxID=3233011 RepID=UPI003F910124
MSMLKCRPAVLASFTAVLLSSCAVGPNFSSPPTPDVAGYTPEPLASPRAAPGAPRIAGQRFTSGADIPTRWWAAFRSKPLNDLIRLSIAHNPSLQASEAAIRVAQFNALAQRGLFFPQIGANYTPSDLQQSANGTVDPEVTPQTRYTLHTAQLNVSFTPDI